VRGNLIDVDDLAAARNELEARGLAFTGPDQDTPYGRFAPFADPVGNRWSLHEPSGA
jgi:predicted enzyme related to lactoylglutathione lyase